MTISSKSYVREKICIELAALKHASPKGVYVAPSPEESLTWTGVLFIHKGPYADAVLRFQVDFPEDYPMRPPVITFLSDVFHPLVTPVSTYTHTTRGLGADTVSSADEERLPPGGLTLRHGFPEWFSHPRRSSDTLTAITGEASQALAPSMKASINTSNQQVGAHIVEVLQYLRVAFDTEPVLDSIPFELAANGGAWHAWKSYRSKMTGKAQAAPAAQYANDSGEASAVPARQQPGGARRPGEWNWQGVWEDRVQKSIQAGNSEHVLFAGDDSSVISFQNREPGQVAAAP